jgi:transposase
MALLTALFPPTCPVQPEAVTVEQETLHLRLTTTAPTSCCPLCAAPSSAVHSRYQRHLADLPWGPLAVRLHLTVRTCVCRTAACARRIFTERLPDLAAPSARKTQRLIAALQAIGPALGGEAGARLAVRLRLATSPSTLLRLVQVLPPPVPPTLQAVGVDEWAWRRGHRDGTVLVDLATHRVVDLLPERSAAAVAAWLAQHPAITVVSRDRSALYADGIRQGAPQAVQVVDRFHLVENLREATVYAYLRRDTPPPPRSPQRTGQVLTPSMPYLLRRWREGCTDSRQLWREIQAQGYGHSARTVSRFVTRLRRAAEVGQAPEAQTSPYTRPQGPSTRAVSCTWVCPDATRTQAAQAYVDQLCQGDTPIVHGYTLTQAFLALVRGRRGEALEAWIAQATQSGIDALVRFAQGLQEDLAAVTAGLTLPWSQGPVEGQITRLKLLKRQSYGRAGFALLRQRLLQATSSGTRRPRALRAGSLGRGQRAAA